MGLCSCTISTMPSLVVYKGILYRSGWASQVSFITCIIIEGLVWPVQLHNLDHAFRDWLCTQGYCIGQVGRHRCHSLHIQSLRVWSGLRLCTISTMPSLVVYKGILYRSCWASQVLFITYTIIEGLVGPVLVHNLDHAFTGCVQKNIVSVRLGITGVIHYIYNHQGFGWACACAQSRPCLHPLCTKGFCIGHVGRHGVMGVIHYI